MSLNRRNALTAVAALPALAVPAAVAAMGSPDAELIALGKKLASAIAEWLPLDRQNNEMGDETYDLAWSRVASASDDREPTDAEIKQFLPELKKAEIETGWGAVSRAELAAGEGIARLLRQIERHSPTTIGGMATLALATAYEFECHGVWSKEENGYQIKAAMNLIQAALAAARIANPFTANDVKA